MSLMTEASFHFMRHVAEFNLSYATTAEFEARQAIFAEKHAIIEEHNANNTTFLLGHNQFSTWTNAEYQRLLGFRPSGIEPTTVENGMPNADSVDWVTAGGVTNVKDQGSCGSCWSFSTTGSMEGAHFAAGNELVSLSEQEIVDCDTSDGNKGCNGGDMHLAMVWSENNKVTSEADYPYKGSDGTCKESSVTGVVGCTNAIDIAKNSMSALMASIETAPTSVAIDANCIAFQVYKSGVFDNSKVMYPCGTDLDHGVLAVGYGTTSDGIDYYLVKNSWGTTWGEKGYIQVLRNGDGDGTMGIQMDATRAVTN